MGNESIYFSITNTVIEKLTERLGKQLSRGDIGEIAKQLVLDFSEGKITQANSKDDSKELRNEKLKQEIQKLKLDNRLRLIRELHLSPEIAVQVSENKIAFEEIFRPKMEKLQENGFCTTCGHTHFQQAGNRCCTSALCNCGVRGYD